MKRGGGARWVPLLVAVLTFVAFLPALQGSFVTWDDDRNFLDNSAYRGLGWTELRWMWTTFHMGHYVPLSWMTLGLDYTLWGMNASGYHLTNLLLHSANAVLAWLLARRILRLSGVVDEESSPFAIALLAAFAALAFAIHPLRVESVAWVTERRDVLSELFYLSSILLYLRSLEPRRRPAYWLSVLFFACALLSKATSITLPAVLLLLNVYPLRRLTTQPGKHFDWRSAQLRQLLMELLPFAVLAVIIAPLTIVALAPPKQLTVAAKLAVSAYSLAFYLWKTIVPVDLAPLYPMPPSIDPAAPVFMLSYLVVAAICVAAWAVRRRWPGVTAAWIAFLIVIFPMLGVVQNGPQIAADRYTYHPALALALLAAAGLAMLARRSERRAMLGGAAILVVLGVLTWNQARIWHDSETLWAHTVRVEPRSSIAQLSYANELVKQDHVDDAIPHYQEAVSLDPDYAEGHNNLGVALEKQGRGDEAIVQYQRAVELKTNYDEAQNNWGVALARQGDLAGAIAHYERALAINPRRADAQTNWGNALVRLNRPDEAIAHYQEALRIRPDQADAEHNWGVALARQGNLDEAIVHFRRALAIDPNHAEARQYLDRAMQLQREKSENGRAR